MATVRSRGPDPAAGARPGSALTPSEVRALRPPRPAVDPWRPLGSTEETEREPDGRILAAATLFLAGAECPWACVFCDLWRYTTTAATPPGAIPAQLDLGLAGLAREPAVLKLYNASNFFDPRAVPPADDQAIAARVRRHRRVVVECHPRLVGERAADFAARLDGTLEVALGLETADPRVLAALGKGASLADFERAADFLHRHGIDVRVFVLVGAPYLERGAQVESAAAAASYAARRLGARHLSLIPARRGNGALERLEREGAFSPPDLELLEDAVDAALDAVAGRPTVATADRWDLERLAACPACFAARRERLERIDLSGRSEPRVGCDACGAGS